MGKAAKGDNNALQCMVSDVEPVGEQRGGGRGGGQPEG